ncbi:MAG: beta-hydroxyacyl-ACP dehydratase [Bacteroidaceae bacterium]|nr:beta-hydroxyacyl-ACP dehydratase [Bacteroidaceae bacterium]
MLLENRYFSVLSEKRGEGLSAVYRLAILPECNVYEGHFPGNPVCPGVCNIETIKECAILLCGEQLRYSSIKQCRMTALATPSACPEIELQVSMTPCGKGYTVQATIADENRTYMVLKGQFDKS